MTRCVSCGVNVNKLNYRKTPCCLEHYNELKKRDLGTWVEKVVGGEKINLKVENAKLLEMKKYYYTVGNDATGLQHEISVMQAMGSGPWITAWVSPKGGQHRVKSPALPPCGTAEEAQAHLDAFATKKGLKEVKGGTR